MMKESCLQAEVRLVSRQIDASVTNLSLPLFIEVEMLGKGLQADAFRVDEPLICRVEDALKEGHLKVSCGIVCGIGDVKYLRVSPQEVQWITPDMGVVYTVESDTSWNIVIN